MAETKTTSVKVEGGSGGVSLLISFFFGPFGAFFSYWLLAKYSFVRAFLLALMWFILLVISALSCYILIGFLLFPMVYILMLIFVYKAGNNKEVTMFETSVTKE